jgi:PAS domain S-box-containing protein
VALRASEDNFQKLAQAEKELRDSQQNLEGIFEGSPLGIYLANPDSHFSVVSPAFCEMLGYSREELLGKTFVDISHPDDKYVGVTPAQALLQGEVNTVSFEKRYLHKNGATVWVVINGSVLKDGQGQPKHLLAVVSDITEKRKSEEELRKAKETAQQAEEAALTAARVKSEFLANMSHEIRTPLNGVIGMADLLLETPLNELQKKYAKIISDSGGGLLTIINDILDFSKIEAGKMALEILDFKLPQIIESQVDLLVPRAQAKGISVMTFVDPKLSKPVKGDPGRIGQVLLNLLSNAIKFTERGHVVIRAELKQLRGESWIHFSVSDTGVGISKTIQKSLFTPFTQADGSTARKYGGTGLGLSISKQIVELMGGQIGLESEEGRGTQFWFTCPYVPAQDLRVEVLLDNHISVVLQGKRILVAEDNVVNQLLIKALVQSLGCSVQVVANGKEVLFALEQATYDLILMDCQMPEMDGYEATKKIRLSESGSHRHIPIVALTANAMKSDVEKCKDAGMDEYLPKPVKKEHLVAVLEGFFQKPI